LKGQYLAVEQVMIVALGLAMATSLVAILDSYRSSLIDSDFDSSARIIQERIASELVELSASDTDASKVSLELREEISKNDYEVQVNNSHVMVFTDSQENRMRHKIDNLGVTGKVSSGMIKIVKNSSRGSIRVVS
jgi:hypothetical protein